MFVMGLETLDFSGCKNANSNALRSICEERGWSSSSLPSVVCPDKVFVETRSLDGRDPIPEQRQGVKWETDTQEQLPGNRIEVDPAYAA